jgi:hypothetical protein
MSGVLSGISNALFGDSGAGDLEAIARQNQQLYGNIQLPDLQYQAYNPEQVNPILAKATTISEDPTVRSAQLAALAKMSGLSDQGLSVEDQAAFGQAKAQAGQTLSNSAASALQNAQARGIGGSGLEFAMREMGAQNAAQNQQAANLQQAAASARNRVLANQAYSSALGQKRQQDYSANANNANILNQFNMANTGAMNNANYYNVGNQNQAQQYNQQNRNNVSQQNFNNQMTKANAQAGANNGYQQAVAAGQAAENSNENALLGAGAKVGAAYMGA